MKTRKLISMIMLQALCLSVAFKAQAQQPVPQSNNESNVSISNLVAQAKPAKRKPFALMPDSAFASAGAGTFSITAAAVNLPVVGNGTVGRLTKWMGFGAQAVVEDSSIFEDKFGKVGIGTMAPTSTLTVAGTIQVTSGGFKFADGTTQTTAAVSGLPYVSKDASLTGNGTPQSPLGIAFPLNWVTASTVESTFGGFKFPDGTIQMTAATNASSSVSHNHTLAGDGTAASPLRIALPLPLIGDSQDSILTVKNDGPGSGFTSIGASQTGFAWGGHGMYAFGGSAELRDGGRGIWGQGGTTVSSSGGDGVAALGGDILGAGAIAGAGVRTWGGGVQANATGYGGNGITALGGAGRGTQKTGGAGILAAAGQGFDSAVNGLAGDFRGNVAIQGTLSATGTKNFKIDHPLDPENKYLNHASIESSEALNVYTGNVIIDGSGSAVVSLPDWFQAINRDFRYSLTAIGAPAQLYIAKEISENSFVIAGGVAGMKVSWQVTAVRSDAGMRKNPFKAEEEKPDVEKGHYLDPEAHGQPIERSIDSVRNPELMKQLKERRPEAERNKQNNN